MFTGRALFAAAFVTLSFVLLVVHMFRLQVLEYDEYRTQSRDNRVKVRPLPPTRGQIFDRNGVVLASNRLSYVLEIIPERTKSFDDTIRRLSEVVSITEADRERFSRMRRQLRRFDRIPIRTQLDDEELARFAVKSHLFPDVIINAVPARTYPFKALTAHLVGYVGRISDKDLEKIDAADYSGTSHIGKNGLEQSYEAVLHGSVGLQREEVNALGRRVRTLERMAPGIGKDLHLYLDTRIQEVAQTALGDYNGSIVAIEVETGGIIAMVSKPSFDPNPFVDGISTQGYRALLDDPDNPLFNRALRGQYPPASTIKPFIGWCALVSRAMSYQAEHFCPGYFQLPGQEHKYRCWNRRGHGKVTMESAITTSCDVYFYELAVDMGIDKLSRLLALFGFGSKTGIDLVGEHAGVLPSREWKQKSMNKPWFLGETVISGIGQGYFLTTPLQLAVATATLANGKERITPRLVHQIKAPDPEGQVLDVKPITAPFDMEENEARQRMLESMLQVVESRSGTAKGIKNPNYRIAGKTGTAQVFGIKQNERYKKEGLDKRLRDHALFVAFAPAEAPKIAIAVIAENGEGGGATAAPIAKKVMDAYLLGPQYDELDDEPGASQAHGAEPASEPTTPEERQ